MEFGLEADGRTGCARGDDGDSDGGWGSRRWCLRRGTVLRSALKRQRSGYVSTFFFTPFSLRQLIESPYSRIPHSRISCNSPLISTLIEHSHVRKEILNR